MEKLKWFLVILWGLLIGFLVGTVIGCSSPDRKDYPSEACFLAADCLYRYGSADKSGCGHLVDECVKDLDESRNRGRFEYCLDRAGSFDMDQEKCRLKLTPKK